MVYPDAIMCYPSWSAVHCSLGYNLDTNNLFNLKKNLTQYISIDIFVECAVR